MPKSTQRKIKVMVSIQSLIYPYIFSRKSKDVRKGFCIFTIIFILVCVLFWHTIQSRVQTPFGKIKKGSGNTAIQCLVPEEFDQSRNHVLMFRYMVKIEGCTVDLCDRIVQIVSALCDCVAVRH